MYIFVHNNNYIIAREKAVELGQTMLSKGYLSHVCYDHQFEDKVYKMFFIH